MLILFHTAPVTPLLPFPLRRLAGAAVLAAAALPFLPAARAQAPYVPVVKQYGDFAVTQDRHSTDVTLAFRQHGYWPGGAREVTEVRPLAATREGQPMLLAFTKGYTGLGTILIGVQNGEPLMRPISPLQANSMVRTERDPEWGVPQPGRCEVLLFSRDARALDTRTGELLWFDMPGVVTGNHAAATLLAVSPDSQRGAFLTRTQVVLATREDGVVAALPLPADTEQRWLKPLSEAAYAQARAALKAGKGRTDALRIEREARLAWFGQQFEWQQGKNGWQVTGLGATSVPVPAKGARP